MHDAARPLVEARDHGAESVLRVGRIDARAGLGAAIEKVHVGGGESALVDHDEVAVVVAEDRVGKVAALVALPDQRIARWIAADARGRRRG